MRNLKPIIFAIITCLSFSVFAQGTTSEVVEDSVQLSPTELAVKSYENCLQHENSGVVESAIGNLLMFKHLNPDADTRMIESQLDVLSENGETAMIRRKAALVSKIIKNPVLVSKMEKKFYKDMEQFFEILELGVAVESDALSDANAFIEDLEK